MKDVTKLVDLVRQVTVGKKSTSPRYKHKCGGAFGAFSLNAYWDLLFENNSAKCTFLYIFGGHKRREMRPSKEVPIRKRAGAARNLTCLHERHVCVRTPLRFLFLASYLPSSHPSPTTTDGWERNARRLWRPLVLAGPYLALLLPCPPTRMPATPTPT